MRVLAVIVFLFAASAGAAEAPREAVIESSPPLVAAPIRYGLFAAGHLVIAADVVQTLQFRANGVHESNPFLGSQPSPGKVLLVGWLLPAAIYSVAWAVLPEPWDTALSTGVFLTEGIVAASNAYCLHSLYCGKSR